MAPMMLVARRRQDDWEEKAISEARWFKSEQAGSSDGLLS